MASDDGFEQALSALLAGTPVMPSPGTSPQLEHLVVLHDIAAAHRRLMGRDDVEPSEETGAMRWGHLELGGQIGRGASATVYRAWDPKLDREVALKLFDTDAVAGDEALREGQRLARLHHPHLVTVFGADTFDGTSGVWMELVLGDTVDAIVEQSGPWAVEAALVAGRDLASALVAIHDRDLIHRDVKARNVVRERGGRIVLMDMGAGRERVATSSGGEKGTPLYMAPELFTGAAASERSDVYGLGVLLHYALSGTYPVEEASLGALVEAHRRGRLRSLAAVCPALPQPVTALVDCLCAADPAERPSSAREAESLLNDCLAQLVADFHQVPTPVERAWARLAEPLAVAAVAALLGAGLILATWDTGFTRDLRWAAGIRSPSSRLFVTKQGAVETVVAGRLTLLTANPSSALPLAVSSGDGMVITAGGTPPFEQGGLRVPAGGGPGQSLSAPFSLCCFVDGTTDGRFNYAIRRDDTRAPGSRLLAPATLYRFSRAWTDPQPLFELDVRPVYFGVTYVPLDDTFVATRQASDDPAGRLERWSRGGRRLSVVAETTGIVRGVAYDPADKTLWVVRDPKQGGGGAEVVAFALDGRLLGVLDLPQEGPFSASGAEFALPDAEPWLPRTRRRLGEWLRW